MREINACQSRREVVGHSERSTPVSPRMEVVLGGRTLREINACQSRREVVRH